MEIYYAEFPADIHGTKLLPQELINHNMKHIFSQRKKYKIFKKFPSGIKLLREQDLSEFGK